MIDCQTGIVLHKYKAPGEVSAGSGSRGAVGRVPGSATCLPGDPALLGHRPPYRLVHPAP